MKTIRDVKAELECILANNTGSDGFQLVKSIRIVLAGINNSVEKMYNKEEQYKENC